MASRGHDEPPLGRLADVCLDERDPELAAGYLARIAELTRAVTRRSERRPPQDRHRAPGGADIRQRLRIAEMTVRLD